MLKKFLLAALFSFFVFIVSAGTTSAQNRLTVSISPTEVVATESAEATASASEDKLIDLQQDEDLTLPEEDTARQEFLALFQKRPINEPGLTNFIGFAVQYAVRTGVPANTIILVLLLPLVATLVVVFRQIIGMPTLEMLVPIALSITLVATGLFVGAILLATILFASVISRFILKKIRIMQLPKMALSLFLVSLFVFASLVVSASLGLFAVDTLSFLPVILLILLSDKIVGLHMARGTKAALVITLFTLFLGAVGYIIVSLPPLRNFVLLYPESILLLVPINILIGRYFGLRLTEYYRFSAFKKYVD